MNIIKFFTENPQAAAIVGGGSVMSIVIWCLKKLEFIPASIWYFIYSKFMSKYIMIEGTDMSNKTNSKMDEFTHYMINNIKHKILSSNVSTAGSSSKYIFSPGVYHINNFIYEYKVFIALYVENKQSNMPAGKSTISTYILQIYGLHKHRERFIKLLNMGINYSNSTSDVIENNDVLVYSVCSVGNGISPISHRWRTISPRHKESFFMNDNDFNKIYNHINNFIKSKTTYHELGIRYKTGIMLHGEAGTGKNSLVNVLASELKLPIIVLNTNIFNTGKRIDTEGLTSDISTSLDDINEMYEYRSVTEKYKGKPAIYFIDEIDKFLKEDDTNDGRISELLKFLDGTSSPENAIIIATANDYDYIEKLEPALVRSGRFDIKLKMNRIGYEDADRMVKYIIPNRSIEDYKDYISGGQVNTSELSQKLLSDRIQIELNK